MLQFPKIKLIWQSPRFFFRAGLYLKVNNKRYRIFKVGLN